MSKSKYVFINKWKQEMIEKIHLVRPDLDDDKIDKYLNQVIKKTFKDPKCNVVNSYKEQTVQSSLLNITQFIDDHKPILAGYGCMYHNQNEVYNPSSTALMDSINTRKALKKERKKYDKRSYEFLMLDIGQGNEKVIANSFYGANGNKTSVFYNRDIASSITSSGQAEIAVAETSFESFLANNVLFLDMDECMLFISNVINHTEYKSKIPKLENDKAYLYDKLMGTFRYPASVNSELLIKIIEGMSEEDRAKVYYKNNLIPFLRDYKPAYKILHKLVNKTKSFRDPNSIPEELVDDLNKLWDYVKEFVVYDFPVRNRIERDKYMGRKACVVQDTDSTMLTLDSIMNFMVTEVAEDNVAAESDDDFDYILVNIACFMLTLYSNMFFDRYGRDCNIPKDYRWMINMKNEFYYPMLVTTKAKKHYITLTKLQEGKEIVPPKIEMHGLEIAKAETSEYTYKFFFDIIKNDIMYAENIDVSKILARIHKFKQTIHESLENGKMEFLPLKSVKEVEAYKKPFSEQGIRAARIWNLLYPELTINLPDKFLVLAIKCGKEKDFQAMRAYIPQDKFEALETGVYQCEEKSIRTNGFNIIALPQNVETIPEWIIPLIDYEKIINDNVSKFNQILESLGIVLLYNTKSEVGHASNIIQF